MRLIVHGCGMAGSQHRMKSGFLCLLVAWAAMALGEVTAAAQPQSAASPAVRPIGVVTAIQRGSLHLRTDAGPQMLVQLPNEVSVLRVPPGAKDLNSATPIKVGDINAGDRVFVRGKISDDQKSILATTVIVMAQTDLAKKHEAERLEWRQRGIGGLVTALNAATKEITVSVPNVPPTPGNISHPVAITLTANAQLLRYAQDSIKFSDAKPGSFEDIKVGDQLRALGTKSEDGSRYNAEEVVSGTFLNMGATVISVDAPNHTVTVKDLATGEPVLVRTNADSKLHQLPPFLATMIARLNSDVPAEKEAPGEAGGSGPGNAGGAGSRPGTPSAEQGGTGGRRGGGPPGDLNQMLERTPTLSLADLKPGEPLIVVSLEGATPGQVTGIAVLSGVEPILQARPKGSRDVRLGPWSMDAGGGGGQEAAGGGQGP
jgi:hypothetical protein